MAIRLNDPRFNVHGLPRRFSPLGKIEKNEKSMNSPAVQVEYFEPVANAKPYSKSDGLPWRPIKLINDSRGVAYTIHARMRWTDIVREVLQDNTNSSNLAKLVRGECKMINGWRCEFL
jgi:hypothetical protein